MENVWIFAVICILMVATSHSLECYSCSHDNEGPIVDEQCQSGHFPQYSKKLMPNCTMCSVTTYEESDAVVRGCELGVGDMKLGCSDMDFFGTVFHVCLCAADGCNDASSGASPANISSFIVMAVGLLLGTLEVRGHSM